MVSWEDLRLCIRARFVPPHYRKELFLKLQWLQQGTQSADAYFKELETILTKVDMHESEKSKMARFVSSLKRDIQDVVELYEYSCLEKLVTLPSRLNHNFQRNPFPKILRMMATTNQLGKIKPSFLLRLFPPIL